MEEVKRVPVVEQVMQGLQNLIAENHYRPGDKMPTEKEVCELFHVGRSTVREAYRMLQIMGILESRQGSGSVISKGMNASQQGFAQAWFTEGGVSLSDLLETLAAFEPALVRLAVERASAEEIDSLENAYDRFHSAGQRSDAASMIKQEEGFWLIIAKAGQNHLLEKMEMVLSACVSGRRLGFFAEDSNVEETDRLYRTILEAFRKKSPETAERAVASDLKKNIQRPR